MVSSARTNGYEQEDIGLFIGVWKFPRSGEMQIPVCGYTLCLLDCTFLSLPFSYLDGLLWMDVLCEGYSVNKLLVSLKHIVLPVYGCAAPVVQRYWWLWTR